MLLAFFMLAFIAPQAQAGFLSGIWKMFIGAGAEAEETSSAAAIALPLLGSVSSASAWTNAIGGPPNDAPPALPAVQDSALVASRNPTGILPNFSFDQIVVYTVLPDDTPSSIASRFGITLNTLLWANNLRNPNLIKVGDELIILPVPGILYEVKKGDTLGSIAKKFNGDEDEILSLNDLAIGEPLKEGTQLIIPNVELAMPSVPSSRQPSRSLTLQIAPTGYYLRPIIGGRNVRATWANPHGIHGRDNAVDLASPCGSPIYAAVKGKVVIARTSGWNGGYGVYVVIAHQRGQTLYAHMSTVMVVSGQSVGQGQQIGTIGSTGNSTGCHVHFGILGGDANLF